jgi:hypothetical protein
MTAYAYAMSADTREGLSAFLGGAKVHLGSLNVQELPNYVQFQTLVLLRTMMGPHMAITQLPRTSKHHHPELVIKVVRYEPHL